jgi:hypothetical protein
MCGFDRFSLQGVAQKRAIAFASRKSRMRAPLDRRTEKIGACVADPFANGEGAGRSDTFTIPKKGAGGGCIDPSVELRTTLPTVNPNEAAATIHRGPREEGRRCSRRS